MRIRFTGKPLGKPKKEAEKNRANLRKEKYRQKQE